MAHQVSITDTSANAAADAVARLLDNGYIKLYSGTQPANAGTALSGNTLLATLRCNATSAPAASAGVLTFNAITSDTDAAATGTVTFARFFKSDGTTVVMDYSVGTSGADINLGSTSIVQHGTVSITALSYTQSKS